MFDLIREIDWAKAQDEFYNATPFDHVVIDDFFRPEVADQLSSELPDYNDPDLGYYANAIENKKVLNKWDRFPPLTYKVFTYLGREDFISKLKGFLGIDQPLWMDYGLNGGGWHLHSRGGNNNVHLDYNLHPKLGEQRKLNLIVYLTPDWDPTWGGGLELWSHDEENHCPKECIKTVENKFNRAVLFDTTQNSWHGLPTYLTCPEGVIRKSIAAYYLIPASEGADPRVKALFAPREEQKGDESVKELIQRRSGMDTASNFYKGKL